MLASYSDRQTVAVFSLLQAHVFDPVSVPYLRVTAAKILEKVEKWGKTMSGPGHVTTYEKRVEHDQALSQQAFRDRYIQMKAKYKHWVPQWPENTDPQKFVFEEVAIASYLCALWEGPGWRGGGKPQTFVDLGCGNGFLTHILTEEGHIGKGYDRQKRKIWDM